MSHGDETVATAPLSDPPRPGELVLVAIAGDRATSYRVGASFVVGRSRECEVRVDDPSISRKHARFTIERASSRGTAPLGAPHLAALGSPIGERITVEDLGGLNGTRVRGRALKNRAAEITVGEAVDVGTVMLVLQRVVGDAPPPPRELGEAMSRLHALVERVAAGTLPVLITGETGAGKEVLAEELHRKSPRRKGPFVRLNCAAVAESLLESELFGHEKSAFTGADAAKAGLIETAHGGTLLFDEVGELPLPLQAKFLRVIETREVMRVGALKPRAVDVRFLAATHRELGAEVRAGRFRQDLYFRLNGITLRVPPLRERPEELAGLVRQFVAAAAKGLGRRAPKLDAAALAALGRHAWPGNVRELRNVIDRAVLLADDRIGAAHIVFDEEAPPADDPERARILAALAECGGNQTRAAERLGISRRTLTNRLNEFALPRPRK